LSLEKDRRCKLNAQSRTKPAAKKEHQQRPGAENQSEEIGLHLLGMVKVIITRVIIIPSELLIAAFSFIT
jgi:hypothetical protein